MSQADVGQAGGGAASRGGRSRSKDATAWIQSQIRDGVWPLNSRIPTEAELAVTLGVGRSTVREATRIMIDTGMLESAPGRGTFVRARNAVNSVLSDFLLHQTIEDVLELRRALEVEAAGLAAARRTEVVLDRMAGSIAFATKRRTPSLDLPAPGDLMHADSDAPGSFHADIFLAAGNALLAELYQCAIVALRRAVEKGLLTPAASVERDSDHQRIFAAIADGDVEAAQNAAAFHADRDFTVPVAVDVAAGAKA